MIIFIDLFAGAGGVTTGIERAKNNKRKLAKVIACVNHDPLAIKSHAYNHKHVLHFVEDIRKLDLAQLKRLVDFYRKKYPTAVFAIWASLECTNFSKAKGGMSRDADSRTLAEHLPRYIDALNPEYIFIENVVEFLTWGPLIPKVVKSTEGYESCSLTVTKRKDNQIFVSPCMVPDPELIGTDFERWKTGIESMGFRYEHRILNSANYGAYTKRERYFAQFAKGDLPIVWPEPTHSKKENPKLQKWKPVKEVLDFEDEGNSVFNRWKRIPTVKKTKQGYLHSILKPYDNEYKTYGPLPDPLSPKTMQRLFMGSVKHIAGGKDKYNEAVAFITKWNSNNAKRGGNNGSSIDEPAPVITTQNRLDIAKACFLDKAYSGKPEDKNSSVDSPSPTVTTIPHESLVQASFISRYNGVNGGKHDNSQSVEGPVGALGTGDNHAKVTAHFMQHYYSEGGQLGSIDARQDKAPLYLIACKKGVIAVPVYEGDCEWTIKLKEFMAIYGISDIKMRMLKVPELLQIQGFPRGYYLAGTQADQKRFIGNAVEVNMAKSLVATAAQAVDHYLEVKMAA